MPVKCKKIPTHINSVSKYFEVIEHTLQPKDVFWFRGHADIKWDLRPSALRLEGVKNREKALHNLLSEFKKFAYHKVPNPPQYSDELAWMGMAQHHGLPTRFLDWTQSPAVALYFCVSSKTNTNGAIYLMNPLDVNFKAKKERRVFDIGQDKKMIVKYLDLNGVQNARGQVPTIAINPIYNSERVLLQRGAFTLHGNKYFSINGSHVSSLLELEVKAKDKKKLMRELARIGIDRMSIFPEVEHIGTYLRKNYLEE